MFSSLQKNFYFVLWFGSPRPNYHINVQFYILLCMSMLILQFWNYIFTHVMVKSIFLEKKTLSKKKDIHQFFISICPIFSWCYNQKCQLTYFLMNFFCLVSQTTDAGSSVKSASLLLALSLVLAPLILPNTWVNLSLKKVSPSIKVQSKISFPP